MYAYIDKKIVKEIIADIDPIFPGAPVEQRYSADFLSRCVHTADANVKVGMVYDAKTGTFSERTIMPAVEDIDTAKRYKIAESKDKLAEWLENNPMLYSDGKHYSCTAEKQSLLNGNLASYERAKNIGIPYPLKWNSTGNECTEWEYGELLKLSLTIAAYVAPKVSMQQSTELEIEACTTLDAVNSVVIDYERSE